MNYSKDDPRTIQAMFGSIAKSYDRTNAILSFNLHRYWNRRLVDAVIGQQTAGVHSLLDLCCGTGEIALIYLKQAKKPCDAYLLDFCNEMLECAKAKVDSTTFRAAHRLHYLQADAQKIPLPDAFVDCATIAYGIRNVKNPQACIASIFRVLRPGGVVGILELTQPKNPMLRYGHQLYLKTALPILGWCSSSNREAYKYLCSSIQAFVPPQQLQQLLKEAGFVQVQLMPMTCGAATILIAKKPAHS